MFLALIIKGIFYFIFFPFCLEGKIQHFWKELDEVIELSGNTGNAAGNGETGQSVIVQS